MLDYIEYLGVPGKVAFGLMAIFFVMQVLGEILKVKGMIVPEIMNVRSMLARKKKEKETLGKMVDLIPVLERVPETLDSVTTLLCNVDKHYSTDNISMRDNWIKGVDANIDEMHQWMQRLDEKLDKNNKDTLEIRIENMRDTIIDFSSYVGKDTNPVARERFNRIFRLYNDYEKILEENEMTNGEVDIAMHLVRDSYENHLKNHNFIEDTWGL